MPVTNSMAPVNTGLKPRFGTLTFEAEGQEGGPYHSRKLHVPGPSSGLTIGRGYDMKEKSKQQIIADLKSVGIGEVDAKKLAKAAGLIGNKAKQFIKDEKLEGFEISSDAQVKLFELSYRAEEAVVKRISGKEDTKEAYGSVDWEKTDGAIRDLLVDLKFRGDYTSNSRRLVQRHLANNDLEKLAEVMGDRANWPNVPNDRFERRKAYMNKALEALRSKKKANQSSSAPLPPMLTLPSRQPPATEGRLAGRYLA
jgi:hypothetical protein